MVFKPGENRYLIMIVKQGYESGIGGHWNAFERVHLGYRRKAMKYNYDAKSPARPVRQFYYSVHISQRVLPSVLQFCQVGGSVFAVTSFCGRDLQQQLSKGFAQSSLFPSLARLGSDV